MVDEQNIEEPEREQTKRETDVKCPTCAGTLSFDPATGSLVCPYCGYEKQLPSVDGENSVCELDFAAAEHMAGFQWGEEKKTVSCKSCGVELVYDALETASVCPYCGSNLVMQEKTADSLAPNGIAPFEITDSQAGQFFKKWLKRKWFTPSKAKKTAQADKFKGIYLPCWTFDSQTFSNFAANVGYDRRVKRGDKWVTETTWRSVSGQYQYFVDDQLVSASRNQKEAELNAIEPFVMDKLVSYKPEYVAGFLAERYSIGLQEGWQVAQNEIRQKLQSMIADYARSTHHADRVSGVRFSTLYQDITYKHILLPLWISSFKYKEKVYRFLVNGQTGKVWGKAPLSFWRVSFAVLLGLAAVIFILWFMNNN